MPMRVSLEWLKELVDVDLPVERLAERLDMTGTAVESIETVGASLDGVVVGRVITREQHPDADELSVAMVDIGGDDPLEIVCGADNYAVGDRVPVALVGAELPNGASIKKSKIRGVVSHGMMCSPTELGMSADASGLMILPEDAPVGVPFARYRGMEDVVLDLEITPNRPDCLSVAGVAREVGAITSTPATWPAGEPEESGVPAADVVSVDVEDPELCPRYTARVIRGVTVGPSPDWLAARVLATGARPINNIVDVTNYVMFELGQPLHAFDRGALGVEDGKTRIIVRRAVEGETATTLDGQERTLTEDMIVIADPHGTVALAGVMGCAKTEVSESTTDILLESASFSPAHISRTSRNLGLVSEASSRFEKRVDPAGCAAAADRAAALIAEVAGAEVAPGVVDAYPREAVPRSLTLRLDRLNSFLGTSLEASYVTGILGRLGLDVRETDDVIEVIVPTWRPDLEREVDLYEEVVRVHGMQDVESTLPGGRERAGGLTPEQRWRARIGVAARAAGLNETTTYSFVDARDLGRLGWDLPEGKRLAELVNPMSEEQSVLRWTLAPGLLRSVSSNQHHGVVDVYLYEVGTVFLTEEGRKQPEETEVVSGVLAGSWNPPGWNDPGEPLGFFDGKGVVESLMDELHVAHWQVREAEKPWLQPGRSAEIVVGDQVAGWIGEVHPSVLDAYEVEGPVTLFEVSLPILIGAAIAVTTYEEVPRYPSVNLDLALVVPGEVTSERAEQVMRKAGKRLLESVLLFDVYTGEGVPRGKKSLAFSLTYRSMERTLTDDEVQKVHDELVSKVCTALGAEVRS